MTARHPRQPATKTIAAGAPWRLLPAVLALGGLLCAAPLAPVSSAAHAEEDPSPETAATGSESEASGPAWRSANEPYRLVRTLQAIQDRTAHGSREALALQSPLLSQIEQQLMVAPAEVWQDPRNARAAVSFALSGGSPAILRKLVRLNPAPAIEPDILKGVLAYVEGDEEDARHYLGDVDPRTLAPGINGRIALVQSALYARSAPERAIRLLDLSRLLLPGTLVDEGALRREVFLAGQLGLNDKFKSLAKHYLQRYSRSVYAGDFHQRFSAALVRLDMSGTPEEEKWLTDLLKELDEPSQVNINLILAKQAITQGKTRMAVLGARRALEIAPKNGSAFERANLYYAAAIVINEKDFIEGQTILKSIDRGRLPADDIGLLDSALYLATRIRELPVAAGIPAAQIAASAPADGAQAAGAPALEPGFEAAPALSATVSRVRQLIGDSDKLIEEGTGS
ncbi:chemotaxis protein MotC [Pseudochelatococcus sp. B33]